jgi:hypothetical protein
MLASSKKIEKSPILCFSSKVRSEFVDGGQAALLSG